MGENDDYDDCIILLLYSKGGVDVGPDQNLWKIVLFLSPFDVL